jgi:tRNA U34 5-carboxymethylaminomethyl modifying GTPase MnmE/TrmE
VFLGDRGELRELKSEVRALQGRISALEKRIEHQNQEFLNHVRQNLDYLDYSKHTIESLSRSISKNRDLIERAIAVAEENQMQIGEISNTINDMSISNIDQRINIDSNTKQTLAEAAKEIQDLLEQLSSVYPTKTTAEKASVAVKAIEEIEKKPDTKRKIVKALKAGGVAALMELTNNPIVKILTPMLESLLDSDQ